MQTPPPNPGAQAALNVEVLEGGAPRPRAKGASKRAARLKPRRLGEPTEIHIVHPDGREQVVRGFREPRPRSARARAGSAADPAARAADAAHGRAAAAPASGSGTPMKVIRLKIP